MKFRHFQGLFGGSSTVRVAIFGTLSEVQSSVGYKLAVKVPKYGVNQVSTKGARIFKGDNGVILGSFGCNVGAKRYTDLAVIHSLSQDCIAGCFRVFLWFLVSSVMMDGILALFLYEKKSDFWEMFLGLLQ